MRSFQTELFSRFLPSAYSGNVNLAAKSLGSSCQSTEMATLLNSIYFVFNISFLPKYRVIYYEYTVKWCSLISFNWCLWLDIVKILALIHGLVTSRADHCNGIVYGLPVSPFSKMQRLTEHVRTHTRHCDQLS